MTEKLYDKDAYAKEFEAVVRGAEKVSDKDGKIFFEVVLDKTLFFPEEGGQTPDKGELEVLYNGSKITFDVCDVQIKNEIIYHSVVPKNAAEGTIEECLSNGVAVFGRIDWDHRYSNMQQHSGEHIFSGLVHSTFGYDNVGFHLSDSVVTMDFSGPLTRENILDIETRANKAIYENIEIIPSFPSKEELEKIDYRSKKEIDGQVRLITIPGYDICACCAPHVHRTGEIGILKVVSVQNYKGGVRVSILCGLRALNLFRFDHDLVTEVAADFSTSADNIKSSIAKLQEELGSTKQSLVAARGSLLEIELSKIPEEQANVAFFAKEMEQNQMRNMANSLMEKHSGYCGVFAGNDDSGYRFIVGIGDGDARNVLAPLKEICTVKGGGSAQMIQGTLVGVTADKIKEIFDRI